MDSVDPKILTQRAACKAWRENNKEYDSQRQKEYRLKNLERLRQAGNARGKTKYWSDTEAAAKRNREQRKKHLAKRIEADRIYYQEHADEHRAASRAYYHAHKNDPDYIDKKRKKDRAHQSKRRALKRGSAINLRQIKAWMDRVHDKKTARCYHCGETVRSNTVHFDHIIPLSKGGPHTIENLCVSCEPCNRKKWNKPLRAWIRMGQQTLEL